LALALDGVLVAVAVLARLIEVTVMGGSAVFGAQLIYSTNLLAVSLLLSAVVGHFGYVGLALDRSNRREILSAKAQARNEESQRLGAHIAQLDRQRSLGEMSASLGHELNQPLTAILSNAQVAKRGLKLERFEPGQLNDFLDKIIANTGGAGSGLGTQPQSRADHAAIDRGAMGDCGSYSDFANHLERVAQCH